MAPEGGLEVWTISTALGGGVADQEEMAAAMVMSAGTPICVVEVGSKTGKIKTGAKSYHLPVS